MEQREEITVLIHGTFANMPPEPGKAPLPLWWRPTEEGLTAERLREALEKRNPSLADTVWRPGADPRDGDMTYERLVEWSSANKHKDRVKAARQLTGSLRMLADRRGCTANNPLHVNYVAHSHGGNVVLESLKYVGQADTVKPRQVTLLGTPLTWRYTDPRLIYLSILFFFFFTWISLEVAWFADWGLNQTDVDALTLPEEIILSIVLLVGLFWIAFFFIRFLRRIIGGSRGKPAYGPDPQDLIDKLGSRPVALVISEEDEADLMLQLGAAPLDTYRALVRGRPGLKGVGLVQKIVRTPLRLIEIFLIRPFAYAIVVPLIEILLERFGLGFPFRSVMFRNYEMTTWTRNDPYVGVIEKVSIDADLLGKAQQEAAERAQERADAEQASLADGNPPTVPAQPKQVTERERIHELRMTLLETLGGLKKQVHLSHSGYYQAQSIIEGVAALIVSPDESIGRAIEAFKADQKAVGAATEASLIQAPASSSPQGGL